MVFEILENYQVFCCFMIAMHKSVLRIKPGLDDKFSFKVALSTNSMKLCLVLQGGQRNDHKHKYKHNF